MRTYRFGVDISSSDNIKLISQTIDGGVSVKDPVWFDGISSSWKKATNITNAPQGVFEGVGAVIIGDLLTTTGLTADVFYFMADSGGLTILETGIKIGFAISTTELLVDIDVNRFFNINIAGFLFNNANSTPASSNINKLVFSNESMSVLTSANKLVRQGGAGINSESAGYDVGNIGSSIISTITKLLFSNENTSNLTSKLSPTIIEVFGADQRSASGYIGGPGGTLLSTIDKLLFSNENTGILSSNMFSTASRRIGINSPTNAYIAGGETIINTTVISSIDRLLFSNENTFDVTSNLSINRSLGQTGSNSLTDGYIAGNKTVGITSIDKLIFSTEVRSTLTSKLSVGSRCSSTESSSSGYVVQGNSSTMSRIDFSNDNTSDVTAKLSKVEVQTVTALSF